MTVLARDRHGSSLVQHRSRRTGRVMGYTLQEIAKLTVPCAGLGRSLFHDHKRRFGSTHQ